MPESFTETFAAGLAGYNELPCIEFEERWYSGDEVTGYADALRDAKIPEYAPVGLVARNRAPHAAAVVGLLSAGRWVSMIYSFQSPESIAHDVEQLGLAAVIAYRENWTAPVIAAAERSGSAGVAISLQPPTVELIVGLDRTGANRQHAAFDGTAGLHVLTSGTTGPPKRQAIHANVLERTVFSVTGGNASPDDPPELIYWPLGGIGGVCQLVTGVYIGKRMVLLEKFSVEGGCAR